MGSSERDSRGHLLDSRPSGVREPIRGRGVAPTAHNPFAGGRVLEDEPLRTIGDRYGKTSAQVALRWLVQELVAVIPKAFTAVHSDR